MVAVAGLNNRKMKKHTINTITSIALALFFAASLVLIGQAWGLLPIAFK